MKPPYSLKIDAYAHIVPPKYREALYKAAPEMHEHGDRNYRQTINAIEQMDITEEDNARKLMRLPI
jgi:hypothetical protein